ncbi:hypothetical protein N2600_02415 [Rhizobium sp. WSM1274]|uniref:hypothetical protein n=1 Tax=Rhizobium sp. WSM1274 TaxID=3138254 RepID=UPI0021A41462|nr:hypothetical protein [Rhizobium leguminosarum]UWU28845.1 hypothetical protein N2600_02415 [Rhizobium leguminosarum bv. viciae]
MFKEYYDPVTLATFLEWLRVKIIVDREHNTSTITALIEEFSSNFPNPTKTAKYLIEWFNGSVSGGWRTIWEGFIRQENRRLCTSLRSPAEYVQFLARERLSCLFLYHNFHRKFEKFISERSDFFHFRSGEHLNVFRSAKYIRENGGSDIRDQFISRSEFVELPALAIWSSDVRHGRLIGLAGLREVDIINVFDHLVVGIKNGMELDELIARSDAYITIMHDEAKVRNSFHNVISGSGATIIQGVEGDIFVSEGEAKKLTAEVRSVFSELANVPQSSLNSRDQLAFAAHLKNLASAESGEEIAAAKGNWHRWLRSSRGVALNVSAVTSDIVTIAGTTGVAGLAAFVLSFLGIS